jgi:hypothetical protein
MSDEFKYEVAFSFAQEDEQLAGLTKAVLF